MSRFILGPEQSCSDHAMAMRSSFTDKAFALVPLFPDDHAKTAVGEDHLPVSELHPRDLVVYSKPHRNNI